MRLTIVIIGTEILLGQVTDTNSGYIARSFVPRGWEVVRTVTVGDSRDAILRAVESAMRESDLVITTGGLGPTKDDITKGVLCQYFGGHMVYDDAVASNVERIFAKRGLKLNALTKNQAWVPSTCRVIQNQLGTAPIMWFERDGHVLVSMPGVPFETEGMLQREVIGRVMSHFRPDQAYVHHTLLVSGLPESALAELLDDFEKALPANMKLAYLPDPGYIKLRLDASFPVARRAEGAAEAECLVEQLKAILGPLVICDGDATPADALLGRLRAAGRTMATAESCTGGNIAHCITSVAGSSDVYVGSVVSYSNSVKVNVLGVSESDINAYGAVSEQVVSQMAQGACRVTGADCAVATSGIAGPGGGSADKPVGTVWMATCVDGQVKTRLLHLPGGRQRVIGRASTEAMLMLLGELK